MYKRYIYWEFSRDTIIPLSSSWPLGVEERRSKNISNPTEFFDGGCVNFKLLKMVHNSSMLSSKRVSVWKHSSSSVGCRAGDYELPPATTILCQFRQLARGQSCCLCLPKGAECIWEKGFVAFLVFSSRVVET